MVPGLNWKAQALFEYWIENLQNPRKTPGQLGLTNWSQKSFDTAKNEFFDIFCCKKNTFELFMRVFSQFNF